LNALITSLMAGAARALGSGHLAALARALVTANVSLNGRGVLSVDAVLKVLAVPGIVTITDSVQFRVGVSDQPAGRVTVRDGVS